MNISIQPYGWLQILAVGLLLAITEGRLRARGASILARPWLVAVCVIAAGISGRLHFAIEALISGGADVAGLLPMLDPRQSGSTFFGAMAGIVVTLILIRRRLPGGSALPLCLSLCESTARRTCRRCPLRSGFCRARRQPDPKYLRPNSQCARGDSGSEVCSRHGSNKRPGRGAEP